MYTIVGDGQEEAFYKKTASALGLNDIVSFVGRKTESEIAEILSQTDALLMASDIETFGIPAVEALAAGVPVISTDVGLIPEAFGPKQMQYVLRERSAKCLADAIRRLVEHPEDFAALSEENLKQIQKWDWPLMTQNFKRYFDRCLAQKEEP